MRTVHLVRHGAHDALHTLSGRSDVPLNARGRAEAGRAAAWLADASITRIVASPRRRTVETATIIADALHLRVETEPALDEIDFGDWMGRAFTDLADDPAWHHWNAARGSAVPPGGETMAQAVARACTFIEGAEGDGTLLCVSHCDVIRGLVAAWVGLDLDRLLGFDCDPGSITTVAVGSGHGHIVSLNQRPR